MQRRAYAGAAFALAALAIAGPGIIQSGVDVVVEHELSAVLSRTGRLTVARVRSRSDLGQIDLEGLSARGAHWRLTVGRLSTEAAPSPLPSFVAPALARTAVVKAEGIAFTVGNASVTIPELVARGTDLTPEALAAYFQPGGIDPFKDMVRKLTAASISASLVFIANGESVDKAKHILGIADLTLTDVSAGHIGSLAATDSAVLNSDLKVDDDMKGLGTGAISISALDLPLLLDLLTSSRTDAETQLAPIFRSLTIGSLAVPTDPGSKITFGRIALGALKARRLLIPPDDIYRLLNKAESERTPAEQQVLGEVVADAAQSAALDHLEVDDAALEAPTGNAATFKLGRLAFDGLEPLKLRALAADDFTAGASGTEVAFDHVVLGDYDASGALDTLKQKIIGGRAPAAPSFGSLVPPRTSATLVGLKVKLPVPPKGGMGPVQPSDTPIDVPLFSIDGGVDPASGTMSTHAQLQVAYDMSADPNLSAVRQYGIEKLDMSAAYGLSYDPKAQVLSLERIAIDAADLGSVAIAARFGNVAPDVLRAGAALQAGQSAVFQSLTLNVANAGLFEKVVPQLAAAAKVSVPLFKAQLKAQAEISLTQALGSGPATQRLVSALRTFIDTPKTLSLAVTAPNGLPVGAGLKATDPKALLGSLDITAVANR